MNDMPEAQASAPKLSSPALREKILALVQGIQDPDDLSKARVEALTHLSLGPSEVDGTWSARGVLDSGSAYSFDFSRHADDDKEVQVYLPDEKRYDPRRRHTCALPLAGLHDQLKAMGYRDSEFPGPDGLPQAWQYWKGRQSLLVDYTYHDTPAGGQAACVHAMTIEMTIVKQLPFSPPELPAKQVESIILGLIDGVRTKADLTEPHIERLTGLSLHRLDSRDASYAKGTTVEGWRFSIGIERFAADDIRLEIAAIPIEQSEGTGAAACTLAFDTLHRKLDAANFRSDRSTGVHGKASNWRFSRNGQVVHVDLYPTEPLDRGGIECIDHISVVIDRAVN
ncbi:hypothetical protein K4L06_15460 [Lysobacter sp. BMK333-48F3]|uniref:hypothetical protein n=1 Tax=Lysobacter sp. BMK333-48F3 TaxID=2867962 RepID=UPI001C8B6A3A|nr:hypothetical protein [Lysobacter sp. BMK333-48F3]MBX9402706.1 hypothetical protein [Lysobacter sp. BMK333-48F3]